MIPSLLSLPVRKCDEHGCGHYGASRGSRIHEGVDLICPPGKEVASGVVGTVTKLGHTYSDDPSFRYVQVTANGYHFRFFYVAPLVSEGDTVGPDTVIGHMQTLRGRYPGITEHCHFEIHNQRGEPVDPTPVLIAMRRHE